MIGAIPKDNLTALFILGFFLALIVPLINYSAQTARINLRHKGNFIGVQHAQRLDRITGWIALGYIGLCWAYVGAALALG